MNYVRSIKKINNQGIIERFREFINKYKICNYIHTLN